MVAAMGDDPGRRGDGDPGGAERGGSRPDARDSAGSVDSEAALTEQTPGAPSKTNANDGGTVTSDPSPEPQKATATHSGVTTVKRDQEGGTGEGDGRSKQEATLTVDANSAGDVEMKHVEGGMDKPAVKATSENDDSALNQSTRPPEEIFQSLKTSMELVTGVESSPEWEDCAAELFQNVYGTLSFGTKRHKADERYPEISTGEALEFVKLFRAFSKTASNELKDWVIAMKEVSRVLHLSSWKLTQIVASIADRMRLGSAQPSGPWGNRRVVSTGRPAFSCDSTKFTPAEQTEIIKYCTKGFQMAIGPRRPTEFECTIMVGITEGTIIARHLPQFLRRVCDGSNLLKFQLTIEAQVEGHLYGVLNDSTPMYHDHQSTKRIVEAITLAARQRQEPSHQLFAMLQDLKKAEYHAGTHSLHFYFFDRETARKWSGVSVPFRRQLLRMKDTHASQADAPQTNVWQRQLGSDGSKILT